MEEATVIPKLKKRKWFFKIAVKEDGCLLLSK